jgi:hypothetical protein
VFTTHGSDGEHRLRQHEDALGITEEDADRILTILEKSGYAYVDYPGRAGYGKSFVRPFKQAALVEKSGMRLINFRPLLGSTSGCLCLRARANFPVK